MNQELSAEALAIIGKVQKLLQLAGNNPNEHEAALASAKAMQLLEAYNLDMMTVERNSGKTGKRSDTKMKGGLYPWQRRLWQEVCQLHFCMYWSIKGIGAGQTYQHRVLGRHENVIGAQTMAEYLQQTVERLARERVGNNGAEFFTRANISFREGMAERLVERLRQIRWQREAEDEMKAAEAAKANPGASRALVLADVRQRENDANWDHLYGEGYSAKQRAAREKAEREYKEAVDRAQREREQWIADHPEEHEAQLIAEAKARAKRERDEARKAARRKPTIYTAPKYKGDYHAYGEGYRKGADVGLDQQVAHNPAKKVL